MCVWATKKLRRAVQGGVIWPPLGSSRHRKSLVVGRLMLRCSSECMHLRCSLFTSISISISIAHICHRISVNRWIWGAFLRSFLEINFVIIVDSWQDCFLKVSSATSVKKLAEGFRQIGFFLDCRRWVRTSDLSLRVFCTTTTAYGWCWRISTSVVCPAMIDAITLNNFGGTVNI